MATAQEARQQLQQRRQEVSQAKQTLQEVKKELPKPTATALRRGALSGVAGRQRRKVVESARGEISKKEKEIQEYEQELSTYEQEIQEYEKELQRREKLQQTINEYASYGGESQADLDFLRKKYGEEIYNEAKNIVDSNIQRGVSETQLGYAALNPPETPTSTEFISTTIGQETKPKPNIISNITSNITKSFKNVPRQDRPIFSFIRPLIPTVSALTMTSLSPEENFIDIKEPPPTTVKSGDFGALTSEQKKQLEEFNVKFGSALTGGFKEYQEKFRKTVYNPITNWVDRAAGKAGRITKRVEIWTTPNIAGEDIIATKLKVGNIQFGKAFVQEARFFRRGGEKVQGGLDTAATYIGESLIPQYKIRRVTQEYIQKEYEKLEADIKAFEEKYGGRELEKEEYDKAIAEQKRVENRIASLENQQASLKGYLKSEESFEGTARSVLYTFSSAAPRIASWYTGIVTQPAKEFKATVQGFKGLGKSFKEYPRQTAGAIGGMVAFQLAVSGGTYAFRGLKQLKTAPQLKALEKSLAKKPLRFEGIRYEPKKGLSYDFLQATRRVGKTKYTFNVQQPFLKLFGGKRIIYKQGIVSITKSLGKGRYQVASFDIMGTAQIPSKIKGAIFKAVSKRIPKYSPISVRLKGYKKVGVPKGSQIGEGTIFAKGKFKGKLKYTKGYEPIKGTFKESITGKLKPFKYEKKLPFSSYGKGKKIIKSTAAERKLIESKTDIGYEIESWGRGIQEIKNINIKPTVVKYRGKITSQAKILRVTSLKELKNVLKSGKYEFLPSKVKALLPKTTATPTYRIIGTSPTDIFLAKRGTPLISDISKTISKGQESASQLLQVPIEKIKVSTLKQIPVNIQSPATALAPALATELFRTPPITTTTPIFPLVAASKISEQELAPIVLTSPIQPTLIKTTGTEVETTITKGATKQVSSGTQITAPAQAPTLIQTPTTAQVVSPAQASRLRQSQLSQLSQLQQQTAISKLSSKLKLGIVPLLIPKQTTVFSKQGYKIKKSEGKYKVYVRRFGEDVLVGTFATLEEAKKFLKKLLETTLRASGFIKLGERPIKIKPFSPAFRLGKKQPYRIVQKKEKRLGTGFEVKEIQYFRMQKKGKKRRKKNIFI